MGKFSLIRRKFVTKLQMLMLKLNKIFWLNEKLVGNPYIHNLVVNCCNSILCQVKLGKPSKYFIPFFTSRS